MKRYTPEWNKRDRFQVQNPVGGVFRPFDHADSDDSDEEDDEIQFLSFKEIKSTSSGGKRFFQRTKQRQNKGTLVDQRKGCQVVVKAGFHLTDPWWRIQILRTKRGVNGMTYPCDMYALSYQLLEKEQMPENGILYQFLNKFVFPANKIDDNRQHQNNDFTPKREVVDFDKFVRETLRESHKMTFENLDELLERYEVYLPDEKKDDIKTLRNALKLKEAQLVYKAPEFPLIFRLLPQLLPMQFMDVVFLDRQDLRALETDLQERPWVFGFKQILARDHHIIGCEARWNEYEKSGLDKHVQQPYKDSLLIYDCLKFQSNNGHTGVTSNDIQQEMRTYVSDYKEALRFLKRNKVVKEETIKGRVWIFLYSLYKAEEYIATGVTRLFQEQMKNQWILNVDLDSKKFDDIRSDPDQLKAARLLTQLPVVVISGKGGCGKTTVVTKVMSSCQRKIGSPQNLEGGEGEEKEGDCCPGESSGEKPDEEALDILYTAPTGKAANLLGKRAGAEGYTLHQVTYSFMLYCRDKKDDPSLEWKFRNINVLVVDECSLVAITTFHNLFRMLVNEARLRRIVLLGDVRQLPSIEPGNFLSDMFAGLQNLGCAIELRTNHRSESQLIVDNATKISQQKRPTFDPTRNFKHYPVDCGKDTNFINQVILKILRKEKSLMDDKTSQFVAFRKKDAIIVNEVCLKFYNNHPQKDDKNKLVFRVDDKICMTKNGQVPIYMYSEEEGEMKPKVAEEMDDTKYLESSGVELENEVQADDTVRETQEKKGKMKSPKKNRLCNGEVFFIKEDKTIIDSKSVKCTMTRYLYLSNEDPDDAREFWCEYKDLKRTCKIRHAWARTIHTFQGSETNAVVYYLGASVSWQNWQHVYTAVTRGKKEVYIIGPDIVLNKAITARPNIRWTSLQYQLNTILPNREKLNRSLASTEDTEDLPYTETNSFCMDKPGDEPFTRIKLSPYKPDHQGSKAGPSRHHPTSSLGPASSLHHSGPLNSSLKSAFPLAHKLNFQSPRHLGQQATSSPFLRQTVSNFNNISPVQRMESPTVNEISNNSQWSEVDESLLFLSEEQARNESLLENCGPLNGGKSDERKENGENTNLKNDGCESDATQSPDDDVEDAEMKEEEKVRTAVETNGLSRRIRQDRLPEFSPRTIGTHKMKSENLPLNTDKLADCLNNCHEDEGELTRLCNVAERSFDLKRACDNGNASDGESEIERYSPSLLSSAASSSNKRMSKNRVTTDHKNRNSHRSVTEDDELSDDSDDDRSSPSLLSPWSPSASKRTVVEPPIGVVTPKKQKMDTEQSFASPMRRKLDNLSMSQD